MQDEYPGSKIVFFYDETIKTNEFKAGLVSGTTNPSGPYKGKPLYIAESVDKFDLDDLGHGGDFKPPQDPLFLRNDQTIPLGGDGTIDYYANVKSSKNDFGGKGNLDMTQKNGNDTIDLLVGAFEEPKRI